MAERSPLGFLEWQALITLYRYREKNSSPARYIGLDATIKSLMKHHPPLAAWVGKPSDNQVHITTEGIAICEAST